MSGHSKWSTIKRAKEVVDKKRASTFTKLSKDITVATKLGDSGDLEFNAMLKVAVDKAKAANMPNDNIQKAINRGMGISDSADIILENTYEFHGPNGTALLVDCETDNANRTLTYLKTLANRMGLKMASSGSISWQFKEVGVIEVNIKDVSKREDQVLELMELEGLIDILKADPDEPTKIILWVNKESLKNSIDSIKKDFPDLTLASAELQKMPDNYVDISGIEDQLSKIEDVIEELDDVSSIWSNYKLNK